MPGSRTPSRRPVRTAAVALFGLIAACGSWCALRGEQLPQPDDREPIRLEASYSQEWTANGEAVAILRGRCRVSQGNLVVDSERVVVWLREENGPQGRRSTLTAYFEENVSVGGGEGGAPEPSRSMTFTSTGGVNLEIGRRIEEPDGALDPLYQRAEDRRDAHRKPVRQAQFLDRFNGPPAAGGPPGVGPPVSGSSELRRVRIFPRSAVPYDVLSYQNTKTTPPEQVWVLSGGVNLLIDGVQQFGTVDLAADRMVIWTQLSGDNEEFRAETLQTRDTPFQVYMEGNIVIRQGRNVARAAQAVYDAREDRGLLHNAELRSFVPELHGSVRLRAEQIRQLSQKSFQAKNAWTTGSQFGQPGYRLQSSEVFLDYRERDPWLGRGGPIDPITGMPVSNEIPYVTALDNTIYLENAPVGFLPYVSGPAEDPNVPLRNLGLRQDKIFGAQVRSTWDMFQLLGMQAPRGVEWNLNADYLSKRGFGIGTTGKYEGQDLLGMPGRYFGDGIGYYIHDKGKDRLGSDRRDLTPETEDRGRFTLHHRHEFPDDLTLLAEIGLLSDRNFLEQYYEREFDRQKDVETLAYLNKRIDNVGLSALVRPNPTDFEYNTEWLPRGDLYVLSEPLFGGALTWSTHTSAGYARLRTAQPPSDPQDLFTPIPFYQDGQGVVAMTRHELNAPFNLGPVQLTPYVMGEGAFWGEDFTGDSLDRFVANAGLRSSIMFTRIYPYARSDIFNVNGLAHKVRLEAEYSWIDSTSSLSQVPQYNEFDDNAQERFRERLVVNTFDGVLPPTFESRFYAVRTGAGATVTAPWHELIDDQQVMRLAVRQRLQTKVGPPERRRIRDWMTLDLEASFFPDATRDNFGETVGLLGAKYSWNVGERTTLFANAFYDLFDNAQQLWDVGMITQRGERGSLFVGLRQVSGGNLDSEILSASYSYKMSEKWISTMGTAYDVKEGRNIGQSLTVTRVGADFLFHLGANFDVSKNNAGFMIALEPRFGSFGGGYRNPQLSNLLGAR